MAMALSSYRLCGRVPFKSDNAAKLEELIVQGELSFTECEWSHIGDKGMCPYPKWAKQLTRLNLILKH